MRVSLTALLALTLLVGCSTSSQMRRETVQKRSAREWNCPREQVEIRHLGGLVYEARGCGRRATYLCSRYGGHGWQARCKLESSDEQRAQGPAQQAPQPMPGWQ